MHVFDDAKQDAQPTYTSKPRMKRASASRVRYMGGLNASGVIIAAILAVSRDQLRHALASYGNAHVLTNVPIPN